MQHPDSFKKSGSFRNYFFTFKWRRKIIPALLFCITSNGPVSAQDTAVISIQNNTKRTISKHIYWHFSEHPEHCIYNEFWVDSTLPAAKKDRSHLDSAEALIIETSVNKKISFT